MFLLALLFSKRSLFIQVSGALLAVTPLGFALSNPVPTPGPGENVNPRCDHDYVPPYVELFSNYADESVVCMNVTPYLAHHPDCYNDSIAQEVVFVCSGSLGGVNIEVFNSFAEGEAQELYELGPNAFPERHPLYATQGLSQNRQSTVSTTLVGRSAALQQTKPLGWNRIRNFFRDAFDDDDARRSFRRAAGGIDGSVRRGRMNRYGAQAARRISKISYDMSEGKVRRAWGRWDVMEAEKMRIPIPENVIPNLFEPQLEAVNRIIKLFGPGRDAAGNREVVYHGWAEIVKNTDPVTGSQWEHIRFLFPNRQIQ